jgi:hypothetical protein
MHWFQYPDSYTKNSDKCLRIPRSGFKLHLKIIQSTNLLLAFASSRTWFSGPVWTHGHIFLSGYLRVLKCGLLNDVRRGLTTTGHLPLYWGMTLLTLVHSFQVTLRPTVSPLGVKSHLGLKTRFLLLSAAVLSMWDALSDERNGLSYTAVKIYIYNFTCLHSI